MELLLIRHALPQRIEGADGAADPELSQLGHEQSLQLADYLERESIDAVYSSPLRRARQTAEPIAKSTGLEVVVEDDLAEFDAASSDYVPLEELKAANDPRWQEMVDGTWVPESGVTREEFLGVVVPAVEEIIAANPSRRVAVSCHGGVINAYFSHVLGLADPIFFEPHYTSINRLVASRSGHRTLVSLNEIAHLRHARH